MLLFMIMIIMLSFNDNIGGFDVEDYKDDEDGRIKDKEVLSESGGKTAPHTISE